MVKLFLDDKRVPTDCFGYVRSFCGINPNVYMGDWAVVSSYDEFIHFIIKNGLPDEISFDHDLADEHYAYGGTANDQYKEKTGYEAVKWVIKYCITNDLMLPKMYCHSMNTVGRDRINQMIATKPFFN